MALLFGLLYSFMYTTRFLYLTMLVLYNSNTAGITSGEGTVNPSSTPEFTLVFSGVHVAQSIAVFVVFCRS
jgi:hypothetical protein